MKFIIPAAVLALLAICASAAWSQQSLPISIPASALADSQAALAQCNAATGQPETPKEFAARVVKEALRKCFVQIVPPDTSEFDKTWPDERQPLP